MYDTNFGGKSSAERTRTEGPQDQNGRGGGRRWRRRRCQCSTTIGRRCLVAFWRGEKEAGADERRPGEDLAEEGTRQPSLLTGSTKVHVGGSDGGHGELIFLLRPLFGMREFSQ